MKKVFLILFIATLLFACGGKKDVSISIPQKMDEKQALSVLEKFMSKQFDEKGYYYYKTIPNTKQGRIVFSWKNDNLNKYFIRYFIVSGKERYVELIDKGDGYQVSIKKASVVANCYGYTHKLPNVFERDMRINFEMFSQNDCKSAIRFVIKDRKEAEEIAAALTTLLTATSIDEEADVVEEKSTTKPTKEQKEQKDNKCSVDKILKMKEIGLTNEEIKKICE